MEISFDSSFVKIDSNKLSTVNGGGHISNSINLYGGAALLCTGMAVSGPIGWALIAGGAYCYYNAMH